MLFDLLTTGKNKASDFLKDDRLMRTIRRALVAQYPAEPNFQKGIHGKKYDRYSCQNCGFGVSEAFYNFCPKLWASLDRGLLRRTEVPGGGRKILGSIGNCDSREVPEKAAYNTSLNNNFVTQ